ncbi:DUF5986 family protein [Clostridium gasigenes]|uniref:DUF5986 family protein n=1 Tax=Clostridium gasigenes TaxID=94869 RepID=UPI001C0D72E4|nr:DUF5986 family protein [Clostridium gasigenes]MBU3105759.1 hypothetical protein [Clostridium gasigenes]
MGDKMTINLNEEYKIILVQAMQNGLERFKDYKIENRTITNMGSTGTKWDMINSECKDALPKLKFDVVICKRGIWQLVLMYDKETKSLYTLMKDKRFEDLLKVVSKDKVHYLEALTTVNIDLSEEAQEQITLFEDFTKGKTEKIERTVRQLFKNIDGQIERHVLITFTDKNFELYSISASIITPSLQVLLKEDWAQYIQPKYDLDINDNDLLCDDGEDINLTLKTKIDEVIFNDIKLKRIKEERNNMK